MDSVRNRLRALERVVEQLRPAPTVPHVHALFAWAALGSVEAHRELANLKERGCSSVSDGQWSFVW